MPRCVIVPGNGCTPIARSNWYAQAAAALRRSGLFSEVVCRDMPDPYVARESVWLPFLVDKCGADADTVLIGHSSGAEATMRLLETSRLRGAVLVSACWTDLGEPNETAAGYYSRPWEWAAIKANAGFIAQFHSLDDPFIPPAEAQHVAENLQSEYIEHESSSHFFDWGSLEADLMQVLTENLAAPEAAPAGAGAVGADAEGGIEVLFVRHAQDACPTDGTIAEEAFGEREEHLQRAQDPLLTSLGVRSLVDGLEGQERHDATKSYDGEVGGLRAMVAEFGPDAVLSSPLRRALATAAIVAPEGMAVAACSGLTELVHSKKGELKPTSMGLPLPELRANVAAWQNGWGEAVDLESLAHMDSCGRWHDDAESEEQAVARIRKFFKALGARRDVQRVVVVSHGGVLKRLPVEGEDVPCARFKVDHSRGRRAFLTRAGVLRESDSE